MPVNVTRHEDPWTFNTTYRCVIREEIAHMSDDLSAEQIARSLSDHLYANILRSVRQALATPEGRPFRYGEYPVTAEEVMDGNRQLMSNYRQRMYHYERAANILAQEHYVPPTDTSDPQASDTREFQWMEGIPKTFESEGVTARLLDNPKAIYEEAIKLRHCLYNYKLPGIKQAKYLPFHLDVPREINKNGVTLVFKRRSNQDSEWVSYERRGKAQSKPQDPRLDIIEKALLELVNKKRKEESKKKAMKDVLKW